MVRGDLRLRGHLINTLKTKPLASSDYNNDLIQKCLEEEQTWHDYRFNILL